MPVFSTANGSTALWAAPDGRFLLYAFASAPRGVLESHTSWLVAAFESMVWDHITVRGVMNSVDDSIPCTVLVSDGLAVHALHVSGEKMQ